MWIKRNKYLLILILLSLITRLPQLLSNNLLLDGDECIVGLMAKHFHEGKEIPWYFYGQTYGFSFIEVLSIRIFYGLFGISAISIKLSMLFLWTLGIVFFYKTLKELSRGDHKWLPFIVTLIFIVLPSFAVWSMKARGGYLTAFLCASIITYLLIQTRWNKPAVISLLIGVLLTIIFESQPLWIVGLIPYLIYQFIKWRDLKRIFWFIMGVFIGWSAFYFIKQGLISFWQPQVLGWNVFSWNFISETFVNLFRHFTGNYYLGNYKEASDIVKIAAFLFIIAIFITIIWSIFSFIRKKRIHSLILVSALSVLLTIGYLFVIPSSEYRYILPLSGYSLLMIFLVVDNLRSVKIVKYVLYGYIALGFGCMYEFRDYSFEDRTSFDLLLKDLTKKNIHYVYCEGGLLQWQLMFYSKEKIIARFVYNTDRYPAYIPIVDRGLRDFGSETALVGAFYEELTLTAENITDVNKVYFIQTPTNKPFLIQRGFHF